MSNDRVFLKDGSREDIATVRSTYALLQALVGDNVFHDAVNVARNTRYVPYFAERLKLAGLLEEDGTMHPSTRIIIVNSVTGEGLKMVLQWPVVEEVER